MKWQPGNRLNADGCTGPVLMRRPDPADGLFMDEAGHELTVECNVYRKVLYEF
jgi:hypothetical protein